MQYGRKNKKIRQHYLTRRKSEFTFEIIEKGEKKKEEMAKVYGIPDVCNGNNDNNKNNK